MAVFSQTPSFLAFFYLLYPPTTYLTRGYPLGRRSSHPEEMFIRLHASKDPGLVDETLELKIAQEQRQRPTEMQTWAKRHKLTH
jgi:hypothetical protein